MICCLLLQQGGHRPPKPRGASHNERTCERVDVCCGVGVALVAKVGRLSARVPRAPFPRRRTSRNDTVVGADGALPVASSSSSSSGGGPCPLLSGRTPRRPCGGSGARGRPPTSGRRGGPGFACTLGAAALLLGGCGSGDGAGACEVPLSEQHPCRQRKWSSLSSWRPNTHAHTHMHKAASCSFSSSSCHLLRPGLICRRHHPHPFITISITISLSASSSSSSSPSH